VRAEDIIRLESLVERKSWKAYDGLYQLDETVLDSLNAILRVIDEKERDFMFNILEDYLIIRDYSDYIRTLFKKILQNIPNNNIIFSPIKDNKAERPKSGDAFLYEIHTLKGLLHNKKIEIVDTPWNQKCRNENNYHIVVDDFIGSGTQFITMIDNLRSDGIDSKIRAVCAIVIQEEARRSLEDRGYFVISCINRSRAIGNPEGPFKEDIHAAYSVYDGIEFRTACSKDYRRGYGGVEASVTMKSTPNNTLPIFWHQGKKKWPAPFPRP